MPRVNAHVMGELARLRQEWDEGSVEGYEMRAYPQFYYDTHAHLWTRRQRAIVFGLWMRQLETEEQGNG